MMLLIEIPGKPIPKSRPRVLRNGWTYTPKKTFQYENLIKMAALYARQTHKASISGGSFRVKVILYGPNPHGDIDNYLKSVLDGMNGVIYLDDHQVVEATIAKIDCPKGKEKTMIEVEEL